MKLSFFGTLLMKIFKKELTHLDDNSIIRLFNERNEAAIAETDKKYRAYCLAIAKNVVKTLEDAEECLNDTYLAAWNAIPPAFPASLRAFLGRLTRNISLKRYRDDHAKKRGGESVTLALEELEACLSESESPESEYIRKELSEAVNEFLHSLSPRDCDIFICRYYYLHPTSEIARRAGMKPDYVRTVLARTREKLKQHLIKEKLL